MLVKHTHTHVWAHVTRPQHPRYKYTHLIAYVRIHIPSSFSSRSQGSELVRCVVCVHVFEKTEPLAVLDCRFVRITVLSKRKALRFGNVFFVHTHELVKLAACMVSC
jgi:hypothetical protein